MDASLQSFSPSVFIKCQKILQINIICMPAHSILPYIWILCSQIKKKIGAKDIYYFLANC